MKKINKQLIIQASRILATKPLFQKSILKTNIYNFSTNHTLFPYITTYNSFCTKLPPHTKVKMPTLSPTMVKVCIF